MMNAKTIADKYITSDGRVPAASATVWAPVTIADKERQWLSKAILRCGYISTRERDGDAAPFLSELRSMSERGLVKGMPWRITKFGRDCLRELENTQVMATAPIPSAQNIGATGPVRRLADVERETIIAALEHHRWNRTHAAKSLGISVRTVTNKIKAYHVTVIRLCG